MRMGKRQYKVMNRCPICQGRDFAVRDVSTDKPPVYELLCDCGHIMRIPRNEVKLAVKTKEGTLLGYHHWTQRKDILLTKGTYIDWDNLVVA
jgi:hypothetical protein